MGLLVFMAPWLSSILWVLLGFVIGAIVVTNNHKAQEVVEKGKKVVRDQVKKLTD